MTGPPEDFINQIVLAQREQLWQEILHGQGLGEPLGLANVRDPRSVTAANFRGSRRVRREQLESYRAEHGLGS